MKTAARTKRRVRASTIVRPARPAGLSPWVCLRVSTASPLVRLLVHRFGGLLALVGGAVFVRGTVGGVAILGDLFGVGLGGLRAVVGGVEARALEGYADRLEDLPHRDAALDARGEGIFGHPLHHVEDVSVPALVFVDGHLCLQGYVKSNGLRRLYNLGGVAPSSGRRRGRLRVQPARGKILAHPFVSGLDQLRVLQDLLDLDRAGVTPDVLLPQ